MFDYVYLIKAGEHYKIGRTKRLTQRLFQLSTIPPFDLELLHIILCYDSSAFHAEELLHRIYDGSRVRGEWFSLCPGAIDTICHIDEFSKESGFVSELDVNSGAYMLGWNAAIAKEGLAANLFKQGSRCDSAWRRGLDDYFGFAFLYRRMTGKDIHNILGTNYCTELAIRLDAGYNHTGSGHAFVLAALTSRTVPPKLAPDEAASCLERQDWEDLTGVDAETLLSLCLERNGEMPNTVGQEAS